MPTIQHAVPSLEVIYGKVEVDSRFSLHYLRTVDTVIDVTGDMRNNAETAEWAIRQALSLFSGSDGYDEPIDLKGKLVRKSASAEKFVKESIRSLQDLRGTVKDPKIRKEATEAMSGGIMEAIGALQRLHDSMVDLRWAILEHDADLEEPVSEAFNDIEELIADLKFR